VHHSRVQWRRSLFQKYFLVLFIAVGVPLLTTGVSDAWFGYRDQRALLNALLRTEAVSAAARIESFLDNIRKQLNWTVRQTWTAGTQDQHRFDALGVLRQVPAVVSISLVDGSGIEQLYVSRIDLNRIASGVDRSRDPAVSGARSAQIWYGPVIYYHDSEPFMTIAVAGNRKDAGIAVAEINLKLIWDVISAIRVGHTGHAFVLDRSGRLIAHPDISQVLRGTNDEALMAMRKLRQAIDAASGEAIATKNTVGETVVTAMAAIPGADWMVFVEQPLSEAFAPIYTALWRTGALLLAGAVFAAALAYWLARRMTGPIRQLEEGTERIGAGQFDHRIDIATGDEFERLATRFNQMAGELAVSQERSERIARLKRFLAPQVAELVEMAGDESVLAGQRAEVVVVFCDLRGFTAFSARSGPEEIMQVLGDYYEALGSIITRYEATLTSFSGDGLMVLVNAPVPRADPALRAVEMAIDMQKVVQKLIAGWRSRGYKIGFGVGLAMGPATVGRIGYENRIDYTAIGNVVNLASRLCSSAEDAQILVDPALTEAVRDKFPLVALGARRFKGFDKELAVYSVSHN
jgi:adenylate cyclase